MGINRDSIVSDFMTKIYHKVEKMSVSELISVSEFFFGDNDDIGMTDSNDEIKSSIEIEEQDPKTVLTEDYMDQTTEDMVGLVEDLMDDDVHPNDILAAVMNEDLAPVLSERDNLIKTIEQYGYTLKEDAKIDIPTLQALVSQLQIKKLSEEKKPTPPVPKKPQIQESFDYKKVGKPQVVKNVGKDIDSMINEVMVKIIGDKPSEDTLEVIRQLNEQYSPSQMLQGLNKSWRDGAQSIKHTKGVLRLLFPPKEAEVAEPTNGPLTVGKFRIE
jgi:hypothetical protein